MRASAILLSFAVVASLALSGCAGGNPTTTGPKEAVKIENSAFVPQNLTVKKGTTVTWTNMDTLSHTVTSDEADGPLKSPTLPKGHKYSYTFNELGAFTYHCTPHPNMHGSVTVEP